MNATATTTSAKANTTYWALCDANGNVSEYLAASGGAIAAHYEYDPFGNTTLATGAKAADFSHRFSSKFLDTETALYYYGYRFLNTEMGRWVSRDPIDERGSRLERGHLRESASLRVASASEIGHAYGFVRNQPESHIDPTGLSLTESFCNAIMPFPSGDKYLIDGGTCYNLGCLKKVCPDFLHCMLGGIGSGVKNLGTCLIGCLPSLIWGAPGYGACVGICVGADTVITIGVVSQCMTIKDKQKAACAVRMCYCQQ